MKAGCKRGANCCNSKSQSRDALSAKRRALSWERVGKSYQFAGPGGPCALSQSFDGRSQLIVYHFMLGPEWKEGCKSCSFWADNFAGAVVHLAHRDVTLVAVSRAPLSAIDAYRRRMGWTFPWYSSAASEFNFDYDVSTSDQQRSVRETTYNYAPYSGTMSELPGTSVFFRDTDDTVYHTYSTYARGLDILNGAYHLLDIVPKGRDEAGLSYRWSGCGGMMNAHRRERRAVANTAP
jgi:predicted dithiol-disulfide oxidoreductase (DUF899 family)